MPYDKTQGTFFYKVSYKNSTPALPILLADFIKLFSFIADFGFYKKKIGQKRRPILTSGMAIIKMRKISLPLQGL